MQIHNTAGSGDTLIEVVVVDGDKETATARSC